MTNRNEADASLFHIECAVNEFLISLKAEVNYFTFF